MQLMTQQLPLRPERQLNPDDEAGCVGGVGDAIGRPGRGQRKRARGIKQDETALSAGTSKSLKNNHTERVKKTNIFIREI